MKDLTHSETIEVSTLLLDKALELRNAIKDQHRPLAAREADLQRLNVLLAALDKLLDTRHAEAATVVPLRG